MKKLLYNSLRDLYIKYKNFVEEKLPLYIYKSRFLTLLYYFFLNSSFKRELYAVMNGKTKHLIESRNSRGSYFLLVRNTHRLEKGLLMRPRRPVFGKAYITETIENFEAIWNRNEMKLNPQMKWFYDVLTEYFNVSGDDPLLTKLKERFDRKISEHISTPGMDECKSIPYNRNSADFSGVSYDDLHKLSRQRRSVRWFLDRKVSRDLIDKAILVALQSPSACNRQPFEFRVFDDPKLVQQVVSLPMGTTGYGHSLPVIVVLIGNLDAYYNERDRHVIYIDAALAAMSFMFALETLGLSSCSINWPDIENRERKMEDILKLEKYQRPIMCIGLGYPDPEGLVAYSEKRSVDIVRSYN